MVSLNEEPFEGEPSGDPRWLLRERLQHIRRPRWVDYPAATAVLDMLYWLYDAPQSHRPPCRLLYSDTNNGKTFVCMVSGVLRPRRVPPAGHSPRAGVRRAW